MWLAALALAGPAAAGAAATPFASSPTIIEGTSDAPAAEAVAEEPRRPHRGPDWDLIERVQQDVADQRAIEAAKAARDAAAAARIARQEADGRRDLFDFEPPKMPALPPPTPDSSAPLPRDQLWQGEPQGTAGPPPRDDTANYVAAAAIAGSIALLFWLRKNADSIGPRLRNGWTAFCAWRRRNSALLIVTGAAAVAASLTILRPSAIPHDYYEIRELLRDGWLTFTGALVAIIGIYDKLRSTPPDKI